MANTADRYLLTAYRAAARIGAVRWLAVQANRSRKGAQRVRRSGRHDDVLVDDRSAPERAAQLRRDGYSPGLKLTAAFTDRLLDALRDQALVEDRTGRVVPFSQAVNENGSPALRWLNPHLRFDALNDLITDERIVSVAEAYLGCAPILHSSQIWLLHPPSPEASTGAEYGWHYDIDDFKFLKVFFYLSDTAATGGEHMLVSTSHNDLRPARLMHRRASDAAIRQRYRDSDIKSMAGAVGDGFFEDTWLYHRATAPHRTRYMLQVEYCATGMLKDLERKIYG
ncbi:MAG: hypothetical protein JF619_03230 [Massilia sp.]|nr:hypothetical protein [Massilia sp.]